MTTSPAKAGSVADTGSAMFDTAIGRAALAWRGDTILAVQLPERTDDATRRRLASTVGPLPESVPPPPVATAIESMIALLDGEPVDLSHIDVELAECSPFDQAVYEVTLGIPPGDSMTYGEVAERIGEPGAAQAVGRSLGNNPVPIIVPCHRVLGAGGKLTGFSAAGGVDTKRRMLLIEGCPDVPPSLFD